MPQTGNTYLVCLDRQSFREPHRVGPQVKNGPRQFPEVVWNEYHVLKRGTKAVDKLVRHGKHFPMRMRNAGHDLTRRWMD